LKDPDYPIDTYASFIKYDAHKDSLEEEFERYVPNK